MSRKKVGAWLILMVVLLSGCQQPSAGEEITDPPLEEALEIEDAIIEGSVELESIAIHQAGIFIKTSHPDYGQDLIDLQLLQNFMPNLALKSADDEAFSFILDDRLIEVMSACNRYSVDGVACVAQGPSFRHQGASYINAHLLVDLVEGASFGEDGLVLNTSSGEDAQMVPLTDFKGVLGHMTLVNKDFPIDKEATGKHLVNLNETYPGWTYTKNDMALEEVAAGQMIAMLDAMEDMERVYVVSTYRSYDYQQGLFKRKTQQYMNQYGYDEEKARAEAARIVAIPGTSEHQTGLAVDFSSETLVRENKYLEPAFLDSQAGIWFKDNAHRFGFILRYQEGAEAITQIVPEAWHYRYVDQPHSYLIYEGGMVLETYIDYLKEAQVIEKEIEDIGSALVVYIDDQLAEKVSVDTRTIDVSDSNEGGSVLTIWQ